MFGGFDFLGNPTYLISNLGTGLQDAIYEPIYALFRGKSQKTGRGFVATLFLGIVSLFTKITFGIVNTLDTVLFWFTKLMTKVTFDSRYIKRR